MSKKCIFYNKIDCDYRITRKCKGEIENKKNISFSLCEGKRYCIGLKGKRIGKIYEMSSNGKTVEISKSKIPKQVQAKFSI